MKKEDLKLVPQADLRFPDTDILKRSEIEGLTLAQEKAIAAAEGDAEGHAGEFASLKLTPDTTIKFGDKSALKRPAPTLRRPLRITIASVAAAAAVATVVLTAPFAPRTAEVPNPALATVAVESAVRPAEPVTEPVSKPETRELPAPKETVQAIAHTSDPAPITAVITPVEPAPEPEQKEIALPVISERIIAMAEDIPREEPIELTEEEPQEYQEETLARFPEPQKVNILGNEVEIKPIKDTNTARTLARLYAKSRQTIEGLRYRETVTVERRDARGNLISRTIESN